MPPAKNRVMRRLPLAVVCAAIAVWTTAPLFSQSASLAAVTVANVSEDASPIETVAPVARDGHRGLAVLRKPPGVGPFPALVWIHGGLVARPLETLRVFALSPNPSRFLAGGYVVATMTYRSRDEDPQSTVSLEDSLAVVDHLRRLPYVDAKSIVLSGCSGGGDLALAVAATTSVAAIAAEEPATVLFTGVLHRDFPKKGARFTPGDGVALSADPKRYYTAAFQRLTREKIEKIRAPILIQQGDQTPINDFNAAVFIPELKAAGKTLEVITYPGEPHCFAFYGVGQRTPRPAAALKAFQDADTFFRRYLGTQPKAIDPKFVKVVPLGSSDR